MDIDRNIVYHLKTLKDGAGSVQMYIRYAGLRHYLRVGIRVADVSNWDGELARFRPVTIGRSEAASLNGRLAALSEAMEMSFRFFESQGMVPSFDELTCEFRSRTEHADGKGGHVSQPVASARPAGRGGFYDVYNQFMKAGIDKNEWTHATVVKMRTLLADLMAFSPKLNFDDLTEEGLTAFVSFLKEKKVLNSPRRGLEGRKSYDYEDRHGLCDTTVSKKIKQLRWFLNYATQKGYNRRLDYKGYTPVLHSVRRPVIYLNTDELRQLKDYPLTEKHAGLACVRDVFLFCCFTGLRYSDVANLRRSDVKDGVMEIVTVKTVDRLRIELNSHALEIFNRYADVKLPGGRAFPVITNQVMNRELKELCRLAGLDAPVRMVTYRNKTRHEDVHPKWEVMGTHAGRRTFVVNSLSMGISPQIVMKWTGHSSYQAMLPYIDIAEDARRRMMQKWDSWV